MSDLFLNANEPFIPIIDYKDSEQVTLLREKLDQRYREISKKGKNQQKYEINQSKFKNQKGNSVVRQKIEKIGRINGNPSLLDEIRSLKNNSQLYEQFEGNNNFEQKIMDQDQQIPSKTQGTNIYQSVLTKNTNNQMESRPQTSEILKNASILKQRNHFKQQDQGYKKDKLNQELMYNADPENNIYEEFFKDFPGINLNKIEENTTSPTKRKKKNLELIQNDSKNNKNQTFFCTTTANHQEDFKEAFKESFFHPSNTGLKYIQTKYTVHDLSINKNRQQERLNSTEDNFVRFPRQGQYQIRNPQNLENLQNLQNLQNKQAPRTGNKTRQNSSNNISGNENTTLNSSRKNESFQQQQPQNKRNNSYSLQQQSQSRERNQNKKNEQKPRFQSVRQIIQERENKKNIELGINIRINEVIQNEENLAGIKIQRKNFTFSDLSKKNWSNNMAQDFDDGQLAQNFNKIKFVGKPN